MIRAAQFKVVALAFGSLTWGCFGPSSDLPGSAEDSGGRAALTARGPVRVFALYPTPHEDEPWPRAIHLALRKAEEAGQIEYDYEGDVPYNEFGAYLENVANDDYEIIVGDAFQSEEAVRRVAERFKNKVFFFGSAYGPTKPNLSVFDNWIHESAYLAGMVAGSLTDSGKLGAVGGYDDPEVNRLLNAFLLGANRVKADACLRIVYINNWFAVGKAQAAAEELLESGVDVLFAERTGAEIAAERAGIPVIVNIDGLSHAPQMTVGTVDWNFHPTIVKLLNRYLAGSYAAEDYGQWSMTFAGGTEFKWEEAWRMRVEPKLLALVQETKSQLESGVFRVPVIETRPPTCEGATR